MTLDKAPSPVQFAIKSNRAVSNYLSFEGLALFMLTLLMVLKCMHGLFIDEVNEARKEASVLKWLPTKLTPLYNIIY